MTLTRPAYPLGEAAYSRTWRGTRTLHYVRRSGPTAIALCGTSVRELATPPGADGRLKLLLTVRPLCKRCRAISEKEQR